MEIEKEVRYEVSDEVWNNVLEATETYKEKVQMTDITCGAYGRESYQKTGKVFRVREKPNKITLEIKSRTEDGNWLEEAVKLESVEQGLNFLHLAGLDPYLYIARTREVKKYKGLKVFFDDIELLGKYIEIEYQDSEDAEAELKEFIDKFDIVGEPAPLYGTIINQRYDDNPTYREVFDKKLKSLIDFEKNEKE